MMDFVFCTDKNYLKGYGVLMLSILRFAPPPALETLRFHILSDCLDEADKATLQGIAARRENTEVAFYSLEQSQFRKTLEKARENLHGYFTIAPYYRLLSADLLPPDVHRVLYLDGDVLCTGSLEELFQIDLKGSPAGICFDVVTDRICHYNRLDYPSSEGYFNTGVMLLDIDIWRKENLSQSMCEWLAANAKKCQFFDQDVINPILHGRILPLDFSYNIQPSSLYVFYWLEGEKNNYYAQNTQYLPKSEWPALRAAIENPRLIHTIGGLKFWHCECDNPFTSVWRYFYAASPWANEPLQWKNPPTAKAKIKRLARKAFEALHLVSKRKPAGIPYPEEAYKVAQGILDRLREEDGG